MRYLITGGAGFIGSALARALVRAGHEAVVLDNFSRGRPDRLKGIRCEAVEADVRNAYDVACAAQGCDSVIHLAYLQGTQTFYANPREVLDVAVRGMTSVLQACEQCGIGDLMLISSSEAYQVAPVVPTPETVPLTLPNPLNPRYSYGGGKIISELMALAWQREGILDRAIIARPHNIYAGDMGYEHVVPEFAIRMNRLVAEVPGSEVIPFHIQGSGQETRSFCYIDDCIAQLMILLCKAPAGSEIYHVGTMDERTITDVAKTVAACYLREIKIIPGTLPQGSPPRRCPDTYKIMALASGTLPPPVPFAEGVRRTVAWYQADGRRK